MTKNIYVKELDARIALADLVKLLAELEYIGSIIRLTILHARQSEKASKLNINVLATNHTLISAILEDTRKVYADWRKEIGHE